MPEVSIVYCKPCGYVRRAELAATALRQELGLEPVLEPGKGGVYEVRVDGITAIRRRRDFFPTPADVVRAVREALAARGGGS